MFIDKLNKLCKKLDLEYKINKGGCCFIAYLISKQLEKLNIPYELVVYDDEDRCDLDADSLTFDETANHYCIKILKQGIVNQGNCNDEDYNVYNVKLNSDDLEYIYNNGSWNCMYDSKNNQTIENIINNFFMQFKNETK